VVRAVFVVLQFASFALNLLAFNLGDLVSGRVLFGELGFGFA
jgi:hypothetical protein